MLLRLINTFKVKVNAFYGSTSLADWCNVFICIMSFIHIYVCMHFVTTSAFTISQTTKLVWFEEELK